MSAENDELRVKVAELCGLDLSYTKEALERFKDRDGYPDAIFQLAKIPDYPNDLNACHKFEETLTPSQRRIYNDELHGLVIVNCEPGDSQMFACVHATAKQRCRAFVATMEAK
jgi:hypothetical protein